MKYRDITTEELIKAYAFENDRINKSDAEITKKLIKKELKRRFEVTLKLLDDEQTIKKPKGTLNYLLGK